MRNLLFLVVLLMSDLLSAATQFSCTSNATSQNGYVLKTDAKFDFSLERDGNNSVVTDVRGRVYVGNNLLASSEEELNSDNSYRGFFKLAKIEANPEYRPTKYKGFAQFQGVNAFETTGLESGMWGQLLVDVSSNEKKIAAKYVFQAGDHMGGTVHFTCVAQ